MASRRELSSGSALATPLGGTISGSNLGRFGLQGRLAMPTGGGGPASVAYAQDGSFVCVGMFDGQIRIFSPAAPQKEVMVLTSAMTPEGHSMRSPVTALAFRPASATLAGRNVLLAACSDGNITHWHLGTPKLLHSMREDGNETYCADYAPTGTAFATGGRDTIVRLYDEETRRLVAPLQQGRAAEIPAHSARVTSLKFLSDQTLLSAGWDYTVQVWDLREGRAVRSLFGPYLTGDALDARGDTVLTGSARAKDQLELWSLSKGERIAAIPWPKDGAVAGASEVILPDVLCAKFNSSGTEIAAGGKNDFRVFDARTAAVIGDIRDQFSGPLPHCVYACAWSPSDQEVAVASADGNVFLANRQRQ